MGVTKRKVYILKTELKGYMMNIGKGKGRRYEV